MAAIESEHLLRLGIVQSLLDQAADRQTMQGVMPGEIKSVAPVTEGAELIVIGHHPFDRRATFGDRLLTTEATRQDVIGLRERQVGGEKVTPFPYTEDLLRLKHPLEDKIVDILKEVIAR